MLYKSVPCIYSTTDKPITFISRNCDFEQTIGGQMASRRSDVVLLYISLLPTVVRLGNFRVTR